MNSMTDFDNFLAHLDQQIQQNPTEKYRIILSELRKTDCPYMRRKVKAMYMD